MELNLLIAMGLLLCLGLSFLLSGMEAGVLALSRLQTRRQVRAGKSAARVLQQFLDNPENFLWTIVVGNTLTNFVVLGWFFSTLHGQVSLRSGWFALWLLVAVLGFYTFFDLLPKMLFRTYPNRLCLLMARPFRILHIGLRPVVALVEWGARLLLRWTGGKKYSGHLFGNREELRQAVMESEQMFTSEERSMINRVLDLENLTVRQITKPLTEAVTIPATATVAEALQVFRSSGRSNLPVLQTRDGRARVAGLVSGESVWYQPESAAAQPVTQWTLPALFLAEDLRLDAALERMQRTGQRLAVVLGRDGREVGIITLTDILKTIFGEVRL
jgi:putative hemolysin